MDQRNRGFEKGDRVRLVYAREDRINLGEEGTVVKVYKGNAFPDFINPIQVKYDNHPCLIYYENSRTVEKI